MKKRIFDKILIYLILFVIIINYGFNYTVLAESTTDGLDSITIEEGKVGQQTYIELKKQIVEELRNQLEEKYKYSGTVEELAETCGIDLEDGTAGTVIATGGKIIKIDDDTTIILGFNFNIDTGMDSQKYKTSDNPQGVYTKITMNDIIVTKNNGEDNTDENNEQKSNEMSSNYTNEVIVDGRNYSGDTDWDLGGVLLKPFFFLVNCIADTLLGALQKIMYSDAIDQSQLTYSVKNNYIDKLRVVDSRSIDTMFAKIPNKKIIFAGSKGKISNVEYPHIHYSPEEILAGKISFFNIDFISGEGQAESLGIIRQTIASCYNVLRLMATIAFLSILIYIGIKIMLSANSKNNAKYKGWIIDWLIGFALLYSMHYIMSFIITIIAQLNEKLNTIMPILTVAAGNGFKSFSTNLIGYVRFCTQFDTLGVKIGYEIMYIMLVVYTFKFTFIYIKRMIKIAFLTLIAPIIAFTYPIDKLADGQAQGFSMWLKEYIFNALLQPMHYLLYYVMVGSAIEISTKNPLYAIVVLMFMTEAEKMFKKIFGFDKASGGKDKGLGAVSMVAAARGIQNFVGKRSKNSEVEGPSVGYPGAINTDYKTANLLGGGTIQTSDADNNNDYDDEENPNVGNNNNSFNTNNNNNSNNNNNNNDRNAGNENRTNMSFSLAGRPRLNVPIKTRAQKRREINGQPIRKLANNVKRTANKALDNNVGRTAIRLANSKFGRGTRAVGRRILRPVWDTNKDEKWNGKRLVRNVSKGLLGTAVGITATAVQAGISLTDGHYKPSEAALSFGAGMALANRVTDGAINAFSEGANNGLNDEEKMKIYQENFKNRDDVIKFCKENYGNDWKEYRDRIVENYVTRGITDFSDIKQCIKYSNNVAKEELKEVTDKKTYLNEKQKKKVLEANQDKEDAVAIAILAQKKKRKKEKIASISYDKDKEEQYLKSITQGMSENEANKIKEKERNVSASIRYFNKMTS